MQESSPPFELSWQGSTFYLLAEKALYWPEASALLIADVHLGKVGHFRRHGIAVPHQVVAEDLARIQRLIRRYSPQKLIFLGDLFHSAYNKEWEQFAGEMKEFFAGEMILVEGNHDRSVAGREKSLGLQLMPAFSFEDFLLVHEPPSSPEPGKTYLCGHIHPGVYMQGSGRQKLRLPCFFQSKETLILPAFGRFTGLHAMTPSPEDQVFVVAEGQVIPV